MIADEIGRNKDEGGSLAMDAMNMDGMGGMMVGGSFIAILVIVFLLLAIAGLIKYLFFGRNDRG